MPIDRTRPSDDRRQGYRGVRFQQGRVVLDRDLNAAEVIAADERRDAARDIVGPVGSPDDGFQIGPAATAFDFAIAAGTYYVGGVRVALAASATYFEQPDWLTPNWLTKAEEKDLSGKEWTEFVYLRIREVEVSAREDADLADVGLGGPDTAGRLRLLVRVERLRVEAKDCTEAFEQARKQWKNEGFAFDEASHELVPQGQLQVGFTTAATATLCQPEAAGGYLHPDNQCIRVKRVVPAKTAELLWGFDNASFLYRVEGKPAGKTLTIAPPPPDAMRFPKADQYVEVLRSAAELPEGGFVAEPDGFVAKLAAGYSAETGTIVLADALPTATANSPHPLFVRIWETTVAAPADKASLVAVSDPAGATGLTITVPKDDPALGAYWTFAPRPQTPQKVYPERYTQAGQPPDGPRAWVAPLAFLKWGKEGQLQKPIGDCRDVFDNLVELTKRKPASGGGCCTITIRPEDIARPGDLSAILEKGAGTAKQRIRLCFQPGTFRLFGPLVLTDAHRGIAVEGCIGVTWEAHPNAAPTDFLDGMIVLTQCPEATIRGIAFRPPAVMPLDTFVKRQVPPRQFNDLIKDFGSVRTSIAIRAIESPFLIISACRFEYPDAAQAEDFGAGLLAHGDCRGLQVTGCHFAPANSGRALGPHTKQTIARSQANLAAIGRAFRIAAEKEIVPRLLGDAIAAFDEKATGGTFVNPAVGPAVPAALKWEQLPAWVNQHSNYAYLHPDAPAGLTEPRRILAFERPTKDSVGVNVLFGSGEVAFLANDVARDLIRAAGGKFDAVRERSELRAWFGVMLWHAVQIPANQVQEFILRPTVDDVTLADNHFDGLAAPYWSIGFAGAASIRDNRATDCGGGFWQMNPEDTREFVNHVPEAKLGYTVADAFPLPTDKKIEERKFESLRGVFQVTNNNVDARPSDGSLAGPAVFFHGDFRAGLGHEMTALVTGNSLANVDKVRATVVVWIARSITVTGNVVRNVAIALTDGAEALNLLPLFVGDKQQTSVAVTGNVFYGNVNWGQFLRPNVGSPHESWRFYNSENP